MLWKHNDYSLRLALSIRTDFLIIDLASSLTSKYLVAFIVTNRKKSSLYTFIHVVRNDHIYEVLVFVLYFYFTESSWKYWNSSELSPLQWRYQCKEASPTETFTDIQLGVLYCMMIKTTLQNAFKNWKMPFTRLSANLHYTFFQWKAKILSFNFLCSFCQERNNRPVHFFLSTRFTTEYRKNTLVLVVGNTSQLLWVEQCFFCVL